MRSNPQDFLCRAWLVVTALYLIQWGCAPVNGDAPVEEPTSPMCATALSPGGGGSASLQLASHHLQDTAAPNVKPSDGGGWRTAKASWYTGPSSKTADGTRMRLDGQWVATRLVPMGAVIEIRNKAGKVWTVKRRDTPAQENGDRMDLPKGFWKAVSGAPYSTGLVELEWRVK